MKLLYCVELQTAKTFTARRDVKDISQAENKVKMLANMNKKAGYYKYSKPSLNTDDMKKVCDLAL